MSQNNVDPREINPGLRDTEAALRALRPATGGVDPLAAAFAAGRKSGRRQLAAWRAAAGVAIMVGVSGWLISPRTGRLTESGAPNERAPAMATVNAGSIATIPPSLPAQSVLLLRRAVAEDGLNGIPASPPPPAPRRAVQRADFF
jgi:hypothetical protein